MFQMVAPEFYRSSKKQWYKHYMYKTYDEHIFADDTETDPRDAEFLPVPRKEGHITIGEPSRDAGVTLRALWFYQSKGLLTPQRDGTSRIFSSADRARLALIQQGKRLGFTLGEIRLMLVARIANPLVNAPGYWRSAAKNAWSRSNYWKTSAATSNWRWLNCAKSTPPCP